MAASVQTNAVFNLGYGSTRRVEEVVAILKDQFSDISVRDDGSKAPYENSCASIEQLEALIGWRPGISLEQGIQNIIDYETGRR